MIDAKPIVMKTLFNHSGIPSELSLQPTAHINIGVKQENDIQVPQSAEFVLFDSVSATINHILLVAPSVAGLD
jgi:hypothetical protein